MPRYPKHNSVRLLLSAAAMLLASAAHAQLAHEGPAKTIALAASLPPYDIVSVKQNDTGDGSYSMNLHQVRFTATNVRLLELIEFAYDTKQDLIFGLTGPVTSLHFDIEAKVLPGESGDATKLPDSHLQAMLISLLADRFQLKAHLQPKILPVYDLVVLHASPKFQLSQEENHGGGWNVNRSQNEVALEGKHVTMSDLAGALADPVHRQVIDKTGLPGTTDIALKWTADDASAQEPSVSIFTAVQEQLGLKLQPSKGPVETLIIDHVDIPSKN